MNTNISNEKLRKIEMGAGGGSGSGSLTRDIVTSTTDPVGNVAPGTLLPKGMKVETVLRKIFLGPSAIAIGPATCKVEFDADNKGVAKFQVTVTEGADIIKTVEVVKEVIDPADPTAPPTYVSVANVKGWTSDTPYEVPVNVTKDDVDGKFFARYTDESKVTEMSSTSSVVKEDGGTIISLLVAKHGETNYAKKLLANVPVDADFVVEVPDPTATTPEIGCVRIFDAAGTKLAESVDPAEWDGATVIFNGPTSGAGIYTVKGYEDATKDDADFIADATATAEIEAPYICGVFFDLYCATDDCGAGSVADYPYPGEKWALDPYIAGGGDPDTDDDKELWYETRKSGYEATHLDAATGLVDWTDYINNFTMWMDTPLAAGDPDENFIVDTTGDLEQFKAAILAHKPSGLLQAGFDMADFETKWIDESPKHAIVSNDCKWFCRTLLLAPAEVATIADSLDASAELSIGFDFNDLGKVLYNGKVYWLYGANLQGPTGGCLVCGPKSFK